MRITVSKLQSTHITNISPKQSALFVGQKSKQALILHTVTHLGTSKYQWVVIHNSL
jgi:hypothetical protein